MHPGTLYLVATPIGNLGDMPPRALETLRTSALIAAEDTRRTGRLCRSLGVTTPLESYHEHSDERKRARLIRMLEEGRSIALVSDGGTPLIADPGYRLVARALERGITVSTVPGPTAVIGALSISGFPTDRFTFEGFLPVKPAARKKRIEEIRSARRTTVYYESPHRMLKALDDVAAVLGARPVCVVKELTKKFETVYRGSAAEVRSALAGGPVKGEYVIVIKGEEK